MDQLVQRHCLVRGRVQGVGFRAFVVQAARELGVAGWVRNREDGSSIELLAEGPPWAVRELVDRVRVGPAHARVESVQCQDRVATGIGGGFVVRQ